MARASAVVLAGLAGLLAAEVSSSDTVEAYGVALVGAVVLAAAVTAWRAWSSGSLAVRLAGATLGLVTVAGQSLASTIGGPGVSDPHWDVLAVAVAVTGGLALLAAGAGAPREARAHAVEPPYAL